MTPEQQTIKQISAAWYVTAAILVICLFSLVYVSLELWKRGPAKVSCASFSSLGDAKVANGVPCEDIKQI